MLDVDWGQFGRGAFSLAAGTLTAVAGVAQAAGGAAMATATGVTVVGAVGGAALAVKGTMEAAGGVAIAGVGLAQMMASFTSPTEHTKEAFNQAKEVIPTVTALPDATAKAAEIGLVKGGVERGKAKELMTAAKSIFTLGTSLKELNPEKNFKDLEHSAETLHNLVDSGQSIGEVLSSGQGANAKPSYANHEK